MKIAELLEAAMAWTVIIEGRDVLGEVRRAQLRIKKGFERLKSGEIGLSIEYGKRIMTTLQELVVKQELAAYALARRVCPEYERLGPDKDCTMRKIPTVFGAVRSRPRDGCFTGAHRRIALTRTQDAWSADG